MRKGRRQAPLLLRFRVGVLGSAPAAGNHGGEAEEDHPPAPQTRTSPGMPSDGDSW